jgi:hypothetical protein
MSTASATVKLLLKVIGFVILAFVTLVGGVLTYEYIEHEAERKRIPIGQVEISGLELNASTYGYELIGTIKNKSEEYTLTSVRLKVQMSDSLPSGQSSVIGETISWFIEDVPPGQIREYDDTNVYFSNMPNPQGSLSWHYEIIGTTREKQR